MNTKSRKGFTLVEIMIVVVIIGLLAAMAIPAFQKVRSTSQEKAITNNLRQIASAAQQYMLETGDTQVAYGALSGEYFTDIDVVHGEDYSGLTITDTQTRITVTRANNETVDHDF